jgi:hypothetical protein
MLDYNSGQNDLKANNIRIDSDQTVYKIEFLSFAITQVRNDFSARSGYDIKILLLQFLDQSYARCKYRKLISDLISI